jgi:tetratricopeptide (TPR) repeat protein
MGQATLGTLALTLLLAAAPIASPPGSWTGARTAHFTIVTDGGSASAIALAARFERLRLTFSQLWPTARTGNKSVIVIAPAHGRGLATLLPPTTAPDSTVHPAGIMVSGLDRVYLGIPLGRPDISGDQVATHEYVHLLVEANIPAAPLWLNEGLAEFFASGRFDEAPVVFGLPHAGYLRVLRTRDWLPLEDVVTATRGAALVGDANTSATFYAQAWALVHYLKLGHRGRHANQLTSFMARVGQGMAPLHAAEDSFGDLKGLERALRSYVRAEHFFDARLSVPPGWESDVAHTPLASADATMMVGDFLTHVQHFEAAEAMLGHAATMSAPAAALSERRALLAFSRQQLSDALGQANQALALDPDRPLVHYLRAVALLAASSGMTVQTTRDAEHALRRAIAAAPALAPAYTTLGGLLAARDGPSLEARMLIQRAITLDPSAIGHQVALGQVLLMSGDTVEAQQVAERARAAARTLTERESVERLLAAALKPN